MVEQDPGPLAGAGPELVAVVQTLRDADLYPDQWSFEYDRLGQRVLDRLAKDGFDLVKHGPRDATPEQRDELWRSCLAKVREIGGTEDAAGNGGGSRSQAFYSIDGRFCRTELDRKQQDGTTAVYQVEAYLDFGDQVAVKVHRSWHSSEDYWEMQLAEEPERRVVVDGVHYRLGEEAFGRGSSRGHGGRRFDIRFRDGREVATTNLWRQGVVPPKFREQLPDNAVFFTPAQEG
jgi:hypothetical protein